jgi:hypothetical protein
MLKFARITPILQFAMSGIDPENPEKPLAIGFNDLAQDTTPSPEVDRTAISNIHPFDIPDFRSYLVAVAPEYAELVATANRPDISDQPDELERWEAGCILARKAKFDYEPNELYLRHLLYEETFSVNQNPVSAQSFRGSHGMTPGGLISHCYQEGRYNGLTVAELSASATLDEDSFAEAMKRLGPDLD